MTTETDQERREQIENLQRAATEAAKTAIRQEIDVPNGQGGVTTVVRTHYRDGTGTPGNRDEGLIEYARQNESTVPQ
jgi:hypothetical protein